MIANLNLKIFRRIKLPSFYWLIGILISIIFLQLYFGDSFNSSTTSSTTLSIIKSFASKKSKSNNKPIIFPHNFFQNDNQIISFIKYNENFLLELNNKIKPIYQISNIKNPIHFQKETSYTPYEFKIFNDQHPIDLNLSRCNEIELNTSFEISEAKNLQNSLTPIVKKILEDIEKPNGEGNAYLKDLKPMMLPELKLQLSLGIIDKFWFKLAESSVWLKDYGVHYMISRIMYSSSGIRNQPLFSLSYAQIFDENWNELKGYKLFIPIETIEESLKAAEDEIKYKEELELKLKNKIKEVVGGDKKKKYNKRETKNEGNNEGNGDTGNKDIDSTNSNQLVDTNVQIKIEPKVKPPQSQDQQKVPPKIEEVIEEKPPRKFEHKILEFPQFVSIPFFYELDNLNGKYYGPEDPRLILIRNKLGYDEPLLVYNSYHIKPDLYDDDDDNRINQRYDYYRSMFLAWPWQIKLNNHKREVKTLELSLQDFKSLKTQKNWTPFISYQDRFVQEDGSGYDTHIYFIFRWANLDILKCDLKFGNCKFEYRLNKNLSPKNQVGPLRGGTQLININEILNLPTNYQKEIWVGIARAHLDNCGCGKTMYRPNLVIITKEINSKGKSIYKLSHVSSALTFDLYVFGWDLMYPENVCDRSNILIPNGLSLWSIDYEDDTKYNDNVAEILKNIKTDYLTLTLTISDFTNYRLNIKGLLKRMIEWGIFETSTDQNSKSNNDNVVCALDSSVSYCQNYGLQHKELSLHNFDLDFEDLVIDPLKVKYFKLTNKYGLRGINYLKDDDSNWYK
ncbi:hypothetical protein KGF54_004879 [Candida jiufengensis]|uniref:uncharacterized protein n=1 Tax=Candida jiufengensis TaxID=497108 RepID=UPI0022242602|nr:uncharacterized protein KGF54_004879 [Candida jiufengensis]KAI5951804.1 hypothetical protein KGF54_004879 [Candida jiufengensis]